MNNSCTHCGGGRDGPDEVRKIVDGSRGQEKRETNTEAKKTRGKTVERIEIERERERELKDSRQESLSLIHTYTL